jgi:3-deoxy-D-manno-octulosonate 8-phosphate phosphatase (KDO 8-P phosphatase)
MPMIKQISAEELLKLFANIRAFIFDVDGVMTDGKIWIAENGESYCQTHIRDGYALQLAVKKGYRVAVVSGRSSQAVEQRLRYLGVEDIFMSVRDKATCVEQYLCQCSLSATSVLYMGDDIPDVPVMQLIGLPACPFDAAADVKELAYYVSPISGGAGCVRDVIEKTLRIQQRWNG